MCKFVENIRVSQAKPQRLGQGRGLERQKSHTQPRRLPFCTEVASACKQQGNGGQGERLPKSKCKSSSSSRVQRIERLRLKLTLGKTGPRFLRSLLMLDFLLLLVSRCAILFNQRDEGRYNYLHFLQRW